ncbi:MAG: aldehyde dehydrogenase family protein, partial [Saprospiraceae bacterium]|nr:aldehyde dehydrogenase family protein [Saprospiraceae bacterium]
NSTLDQKMQGIFSAQQQNQFRVARTSAKERIAKLHKLEKALLSHREAIRQALHQDFHKHPGETDMWEIYVIISELRHTIRHLQRWMQPQRVATPLAFLGSKAHIYYEPKGVVLIIAPWNFPINLTFGPMVSAIAAGNCVMIKPSELTPHSSAIMAKIIRETFPENEIALFEGGVEVSEALLRLPFNHIFYTGSTAVGKIIMRAAAEHLASVTLELGGKSPTIVDETANLDLAARRIAWGKTANSGQTCVAPDYLLVHEKIRDKLLNLIQMYWKKFYGNDTKSSPFYTHIVNQRHFNRLKNYIDEAQEKGAQIRIGGAMDAEKKYIEPTILENVPLDAKVLQEEIFGPILPVITFKNIQEVVDLVNSKERPLALYIFSKNRRNINFILQETRAGAVSINQNIVHFLHANLPFGGVNHSGIGKSHGWWGFETFSNAKAILRQDFFGASELFMPPFTKLKEKINDLALKWF